MLHWSLIYETLFADYSAFYDRYTEGRFKFLWCAVICRFAFGWFHMFLLVLAFRLCYSLVKSSFLLALGTPSPYLIETLLSFSVSFFLHVVKFPIPSLIFTNVGTVIHCIEMPSSPITISNSGVLAQSICESILKCL